MMIQKKTLFPLDSLAMTMAADAGQAWSEMNEFPGYARNGWREEARREVRRQRPDAIIETGPIRWDGRDGICMVRLPRQ